MRFLIPMGPDASAVKCLMPLGILPHPEPWREMFNSWREEMLVVWAAAAAGAGGSMEKLCRDREDLKLVMENIDEDVLTAGNMCMARGCDEVRRGWGAGGVW